MFTNDHISHKWKVTLFDLFYVSATGMFPGYNYSSLWPIADIFIMLTFCLPPLRCKLYTGQVFIQFTEMFSVPETGLAHALNEQWVKHGSTLHRPVPLRVPLQHCFTTPLLCTLLFSSQSLVLSHFWLFISYSLNLCILQLHYQPKPTLNLLPGISYGKSFTNMIFLVNITAFLLSIAFS